MKKVAVLAERRRSPFTDHAPARCKGCAVRPHGLCGVLDDVEINALNRVSRYRDFAAGETVRGHHEGQDLTGVVVSGVCKLVHTMADGREQIVGLLFPSDFVGRALGLGEAARPHYVVQAATGCTVCQYSPGGLAQALHAYPQLERKLLERALNDLDAARGWMLVLGRKGACERVATFLHSFVRRSLAAGATFEQGVDLPLNRGEIADYLGLTVETVSRQFSKLRKDGVIEVEGSRLITRADLDELALRGALD